MSPATQSAYEPIILRAYFDGKLFYDMTTAQDLVTIESRKFLEEEAPLCEQVPMLK